MEGDRPYIEPEVLASLKAVVIVGDKTNQDKDRDIVANLVDASNPFIISNAAYEGMSGYNGYPVVFGSNKTWETPSSVYSYTSDVTSTTIHITRVKNAGTGLLFSYVKKDGALTNIREIPAFRVTVKGLEGNSKFGYRYLATEDATGETLVYLGNGTHELSKSFTPTEALLDLTRNAWVGIFITPMVEGEVVFDCDITIEILPEYEGAFVTDGIDDLIKSTKSATEMLDGSNEVTVVSMIHQIKTNDGTTRNNWFFTPVSYLENRVVKDKIGKTGIYGYTSTNVTNAQISDITPILGDKNDYTLYSKIEDGDRDYFTVEGFQNQGIWYVSSIAWYWTIIANKVLTTDQINQVIAYFNLDRTLKPDILCDVKKQGISNENHAEFGDKLIDFSGNGRDIQLNNLAWDGDSGIGKYNYPNWKVTATIANTYSTIVNYPTVNGTYSINVNGVSELMQSIGLHLEIKYTTSTGIIYNDIKQDGVYSYILPDGATDLTLRFGGIPGIVNEPCNITITQIPSHAGALCLDGVNDFGKVTGMPIYKDYTFIIDRQIITNDDSGGIVASKSESAGDVTKQGAFIFEYLSNNTISTWSYYKNNSLVASSNSNRNISYQSKYSYNGKGIEIGEAKDSDKLWIGTIRDNDERFANIAIYSLMSFPYSMSEFLIERQLKKHKLGTLYPDMVEFRPIIKANDNYKIFYTAMLPLTGDIWERINIGDYVPVGRRIAIQMSFDNEAKKLVSAVSSQLGNITIVKNSNNIGYTIFGDVLKDKSPQKISITIEQDENIEGNTEWRKTK